MSERTTEDRPDSGESFLVYRHCQFGHRLRVHRFDGRVGDTTNCPQCARRRAALRRELEIPASAVTIFPEVEG